MVDYICRFCSRSFQRRKGYGSNCHFCSRSCLAKATVAGKNKNRSSIVCQYCHKIFDVPQHRLETVKACSRLCQNRLLANASKCRSRPLGIMTYRRVKKEQCERCASAKYLIVHHKDENRYNNDPSNLETLCKKCHQSHHTKRDVITGRYCQ